MSLVTELLISSVVFESSVFIIYSIIRPRYVSSSFPDWTNNAALSIDQSRPVGVCLETWPK